jgi:hypothetical protein
LSYSLSFCVCVLCWFDSSFSSIYPRIHYYCVSINQLNLINGRFNWCIVFADSYCHQG